MPSGLDSIRDNVVVVLLVQTMNRARETSPIGGWEAVIEIRRAFQEATRAESNQRIAERTGRRVTARLSANHVDPDVAAEIYVLDPPPDHPPLKVDRSSAS